MVNIPSDKWALRGREENYIVLPSNGGEVEVGVRSREWEEAGTEKTKQE